MLTVKKKIISKFPPGLISLLLMAQGACVPQKTPVSLSAKPAVTQRAPQDFIYPKIQITNTKGEIKILQARPLTAEEENMPEPAPFSIKKISHAEMVYGQYVGKDYGDAMAVDVYVEQGTTSQIRSKILGNTCGVNWVMTYVEDPFTATDNYMYGGQRKRISTYISNIDTLKNSSWTYRIEDVLDSSVAYDFPVTLYNGSDAYCGGTPSPSPSPSPSSNPSPTPSPSANPTPSPEPSSSPSSEPEVCSEETKAEPKDIEALIRDYQQLKKQVDLLLVDLQVYESSGDFTIQANPNLNCPTEDSLGNGSCMSDIIALANFIAQNEEAIKGLNLEAWEKSRDAYLDLVAEVGVGVAITLFAPGGAEIEMAIAMERMLVTYQTLSPVAKAYLMSSKYGPVLRATLLTVSQHADDLARGLSQIKEDTTRFLCKKDLDEMALAGGPNSPIRMYNDTLSDLHQAKPMQMAKGKYGEPRTSSGKTPRNARLNASQKSFANELTNGGNAGGTVNYIGKTDVGKDLQRASNSSKSNVALLEADIPGVDYTKGVTRSTTADTYEKFSKYDSFKGAEPIGQYKPTDLPNDGYPLTIPNDSDTEAKLLVDLAKKIDGDPVNGNRVRNTNASGTIYLDTNLFPCPRCQGTIRNFQNRYPNIKINLGYNVVK